MTIKSPFLVIQDFLSRDDAIKLSSDVRIELSKTDDEIIIPSERHIQDKESSLYEKLKEYIPQIEKHFGLKVRGVEHLMFQQFPVSKDPAEQPQCANSLFKRKKWLKTRDRDLTAVLWLKDYKSESPFNLDENVYGGKLEFKMYNFSFQPQLGSLVIFPAGPQFIYATSRILVGELQTVRLHIAAEGIYMYDPKNFPGDYTTWFNDIV